MVTQITHACNIAPMSNSNNYCLKSGGIKMNRPYVICHMMVSLDGKIIGDFMSAEGIEYFYEQYGKIMTEYESNAMMMGRITLQDMGIVEFDAKPDTIETFPRTDYVVMNTADSFVIAVDPSGKLGWTNNRMSEEIDGNVEHVIEVVTDKVSDAYLSYLRSLGISYIFSGAENIDFNIAVQKLEELFSIKRLMVLGGGTLNGSLLNEGFIDEISLVLMPFADGLANSKTIFETDATLKKIKSTNFVLNNIEKLENSGLWLKYTAKNL